MFYFVDHLQKAFVYLYVPTHIILHKFLPSHLVTFLIVTPCFLMLKASASLEPWTRREGRDPGSHL